jgi:hypothetical protein
MLYRPPSRPSSHIAESSDRYPTAIRLNDRCRVVVCPLRIQWIVQTLDGPERAPTARWRSRSFCRTTEGLIRCSQELAGDIEPAAAAKLAAFMPVRELQP